MLWTPFPIKNMLQQNSETFISFILYKQFKEFQTIKSHKMLFINSFMFPSRSKSDRHIKRICRIFLLLFKLFNTIKLFLKKCKLVIMYKKVFLYPSPNSMTSTPTKIARRCVMVTYNTCTKFQLNQSPFSCQHIFNKLSPLGVMLR